METSRQERAPAPRPERAFRSATPTLVLGIGATLLVLFVELQLLNATHFWGKDMVAPRRTTLTARLEEQSQTEASLPPLRVRARSILTESRTSLVSQSE